ncbi:MAG TPA: phosphotransferase family protein [Solirubrobacter sp.]|nr:phosphotransferase family protein [Solirubrobacter sp.]
MTEALRALLDRHGLGSGPLTMAPIGDGHSNLTYLIRRDGAACVLRRPPHPPYPPSAHDVLREARILQALEGTAARVPKVLAAIDDESIIGARFYLMEHVAGTVVTDAVPAGYDRTALAHELIDALVELHSVDWRRLDGIGRPSGYLQRQVRRFTALWEQNATREVPAVERVGEWLRTHLPESRETTVVHGDYRLGNVMFAAGPRLAAILDWEMATIGDPLADVGYLLSNWPQGDEPEDALTALSGVVRQGFPSRAELVARYEERSGRRVAAIRWYETLAIWKAAVFLEGSYGRYVAGHADDPFFATLEQGVPALAERAWRSATAG